MSGPAVLRLSAWGARELNAAELGELLTGGGFRINGMYGVFHGPRLAAMDARHGGSIIDAQITRALADAPWPEDLLADVAALDQLDVALQAAAVLHQLARAGKHHLARRGQARLPRAAAR